MIATTHLAVGAASGLAAQAIIPQDASTLKRTLAAFVFGFASHLVLDAIPHQEYPVAGMKLWAILFFEIVITSFFLFDFKRNMLFNFIIFFGMVGGALPDFIELVYRYFINWELIDKVGRAIHIFHFRRTVLVSELSFVMQVIIAFFAIIFINYKKLD